MNNSLLPFNQFFMINIIPKIRMLLFLSSILVASGSNTFAQTVHVTGVVVDQDGQSLPGATVLVKGSTTGVITDLNGHYTISAKSGDVLTFSFVGCKTKEIAVGNQTVINVELEATAESLDEVVIIGYGEQKKVTVTGAVSSVRSDELLSSPSASIANSLAGKITGLASIQYSGQPGEDDPVLYVRGIASLYEERSEPLMIVDGVERSFMQLDPNEIESISVLKDASATAVYGVKGANGVIIVTTRRGKEGPAKISVNVSSGVQIPLALMEFTDSYTYATMYNLAQMNDNPDIDPALLKFSPEAIEAFRTGSNPLLYSDTDWVDYIMKKSARQTKGNINITGGTSKVKYFVSMAYLNQDGLFNTFDSQYDYNFSYNRYNYRSNLDIDLTKTTKVGITVGGRVGVRNQPNAEMKNFFRNISWSVPYSGPGIVDGRYIKSGDYYIPGQKKDGLTEFYGKGYQNRTQNNLNFDLDLKQELDIITKGLTFRMKYSYNSYYTHNKVRKSSVAYYEPYYLVDVDSTAVGDSTIVFRKKGSDGTLGYSEGTSKGRNNYLEFGLDYARKFGNHSVTGLLLYNQRKVYYPSQFSYIPTGLVGIVGRITYNFRTKYMLDLNLGYNGSENFAEGHRFGFFPAVSAGWIITQEDFFPENNIVTYMKIRVSYGLVGNDKIGSDRFLYLPDSYDATAEGYNFGTNVPTNQTGASENQLGNPDVTWETARKQNYGIDLNMLGGKLGVNYDYFFEYRKNILTKRQTVPGYLAIDLPAVNIGKVKNRGYEVEVKWKQKISENIRYWITVSTSHAKNKIIFMDEVDQPEDYLYRTGHPVNQYYGYVFNGFYTDADSLSTADHLVELKPGDMTYKDLNGDSIINQLDQRAIGYTAYPQNVYGLNLGLKVKRFDVSIYFAAASHTSRLLHETYRMAFGATLDRSLMQYMADGAWTPETADVATFPRMTLAGAENNTKDSDFWLRDASYIRLKNVELGYNFKRKALRKIGIKSLRIYANGYNLFTIDRLKIADPESNPGRNPAYPLTKVYNIGLKMNF